MALANLAYLLILLLLLGAGNAARIRISERELLVVRCIRSILHKMWRKSRRAVASIMLLHHLLLVLLQVLARSSISNIWLL